MGNVPTAIRQSRDHFHIRMTPGRSTRASLIITHQAQNTGPTMVVFHQSGRAKCKVGSVVRGD
ncbi:hypothetical protein FOPG_19840 [Fusarium oxysporum f. sp. conglutinans race 2 54008]|uniref:Uncharacterized protein n=1 Tax=Fusarium oxysporum f. sp. conglutinans race 2 54008 TaxID=1089457 RepID=X0HRT1_FUSOX|nr:hypothetical protein FOPG_19840 [Fusarium oxysporum f. sp. conglutinans race 2 54008]